MRAIEIDELMERLDGDTALLVELAEMFLDDLPAMTAAIQQAVAAREVVGVKTSAHALKGAVGNFSAHGVFNAALVLEEMGRNEDITGAEEAMDRLEKELVRFTEELRLLCAMDGQD
jgi:two-component system, sensor histidine kinase and response regulator